MRGVTSHITYCIGGRKSSAIRINRSRKLKPRRQQENALTNPQQCFAGKHLQFTPFRAEHPYEQHSKAASSIPLSLAGTYMLSGR